MVCASHADRQRRGNERGIRMAARHHHHRRSDEHGHSCNPKTGGKGRGGMGKQHRPAMDDQVFASITRLTLQGAQQHRTWEASLLDTFLLPTSSMTAISMKQAGLSSACNSLSLRLLFKTGSCSGPSGASALRVVTLICKICPWPASSRPRSRRGQHWESTCPRSHFRPESITQSSLGKCVLHPLVRPRRGRTTTGAHHLFQITEDTPPKPNGHPEMPSRLEAKWLRTATTPRVPKPHLQPPLLAFFTNSYCTTPSPTHTTPHTVVRPVPGNVAFLAEMRMVPFSCARTCVRVLQSFSQCFYPAWCPASSSRQPCPLLRHHSGCHGRVDVG